MKIKYEGTDRYVTWSEMFYIGIDKDDEADYYFTIVLFARTWYWSIWKKENCC